MRRPLALAILPLVLAAAFLLWWRAQPQLDDNARIVQMIVDIKRAVENKDAGKLLKHIANDYDDGSYKKRDITQIVVSGFRNPEPFRVVVGTPQISIQGNRATVAVTAEFWVGSGGPEGKHLALPVRAELVKARGSWQVIRASGWERAMEAGEGEG